jgi:hypothetical protein
MLRTVTTSYYYSPEIAVYVVVMLRTRQARLVVPDIGNGRITLLIGLGSDSLLNAPF